MNILLRYSANRRVDGLLLSASETCLRFVVPELNETIELRRQDNQWVSEEDGPVEIESILWDGATALPEIAKPKVQTAGG